MTVPHSIKDYEERAERCTKLSQTGGTSTAVWVIAQGLFCVARELKKAREEMRAKK